MKKILTLALTIITSLCAEAQLIDWLKNGNFPQGTKVRTDAAGNVCVAGFYGNSAPNFGGNLKEYNPSGQLLWSNNINLADLRLHITRSNEILLSGGNSQGYYLNRYDYNGTLINSNMLNAVKSDGSHTSSIKEIGSDSTGAVYITGVYKDTLTFGNLSIINNSTQFNSYRMYIAKFNSSGVCQWLRGAGKGHFYQHLNSFTDAEGNTSVGGDYIDTLKLGQLTIPGNVSSLNGFICKYDKNGNVQWLQSIGDNSGEENISSITADEAGNVYALGYYHRPLSSSGFSLPAASNFDPNFFIWKLNSLGQTMWCKGYGSNQEDYGTSINYKNNSLNVTGYYVLSTTLGTFQLNCQSGVTNGTEPFVANLSTNGNVEWAIPVSCGNQSKAKSYDICTSDNVLYITGYFEGTLSPSGTSQINSVSQNEFTMKLQKLSSVEIMEGKNTLIENNFNVKPIPSNQSVTVNFECAKTSDVYLKIFDSYGKSILTEHLPSFSGVFQKNYELENPNSTYFIQITIDGNSKTLKVVRD